MWESKENLLGVHWNPGQIEVKFSHCEITVSLSFRILAKDGFIWIILHAFLFSADSFQNQVFEKDNSEKPSECQTIGIQIRPDKMSDLDPHYLQRLSADDTSRPS